MDTISVYYLWFAVSYVTTEFWAVYTSRHGVRPVQASSHTIAALIRDGTVRLVLGLRYVLI